MNPAVWLDRAGQRFPDRKALFTGDTPVASYSDFARRAAGFGAWLRMQSVSPGDRVLIFMANRVEYLIALYGTWYCGAIAVPVNAKLHPREVAWIASDAQARVLVTDSAHTHDLRDVCGTDIQIIDADKPIFSAAISTAPMPPSIMEPDDTVWLFYTSGTTGTPKGVEITCANLATMSYCYFIDVDDVFPHDHALYAAPMSHGAGLYNVMHVIRGARHVVPRSGGFDPAEILALGKSLGSVSMFAAPTMVRRLVDAARTRGETGEGLRTIVYAGGPMYEADILDAVALMGPRFVQIYGQGECPMGITALPRGDISDRDTPGWRARLNSVGRAQTAVEIRIVDDAGMPVANGDVGEITVRGATVMKGYWQNPGATAQTIRDGWLWTGDLGRMDEHGYVTLQDRSKDVIISGGSNIYPREIEEVLLNHPDVQEVAVIGRPHPEWGEEVIAFVSARSGCDVTPDALDQLCLDRIARFKRPKEYVFVDALPKNNYGKVLKTELRTHAITM